MLFRLRPTALLISLLGCLTACQPTAGARSPVNPDSVLVKQQIMLKELTTGAKRPKGVGSQLLVSYFGKDRVLSTEALADGTLAKIVLLLDGGDGFQLKTALEERYSKEEGHPVHFECQMDSRRLEKFYDIKVWDEKCTLHHASQVLTLNTRSPDDSNMISEHYAIRALFFSAKITLEDTQLTARRETEISQVNEAEAKASLEKAKKDL